MSVARRYVATTLAVGAVALGHAALTWPSPAVVALFGGGAVVAFAAEAVAVWLGWLDHRVGPQVAGVPLYVLAGWTGVVYVSLRVALLATGGWTAAALAAALATGYDVLADRSGVDAGLWHYPDAVPGPRHGPVPVANYVGWLLVGGATAALGVAAL